MAGEAPEQLAVAPIDAVGITALRGLSPQRLSGGQKQRVAIAAALALSFFPNRRTRTVLQKLSRDRHIAAAAMTALSRMDGRTAAERAGDQGPPYLAPKLPGRATEPH